MIRRLWVWGPAVAMMGALFLSSSRTGISLPGRFDLLAHLGAYVLLGLLCVRGFAGARWSGVTRRSLWLAVALTSAYGLSDEVHQMFVVGRSASWEDWVADTAGGVIAAVLVGGVRSWIEASRSRR